MYSIPTEIREFTKKGYCINSVSQEVFEIGTYKATAVLNNGQITEFTIKQEFRIYGSIITTIKIDDVAREFLLFQRIIQDDYGVNWNNKEGKLVECYTLEKISSETKSFDIVELEKKRLFRENLFEKVVLERE